MATDLRALRGRIGHLKDPGKAIPGHGGILDRIDSLAPADPVFFHVTFSLYHV